MMTTHAVRKALDRDVRGQPSLKPTWRPGPAPGDILVSKATARSDFYLISVVPNAPELFAEHYDDAMKMARTIANARGGERGEESALRVFGGRGMRAHHRLDGERTDLGCANQGQDRQHGDDS